MIKLNDHKFKEKLLDLKDFFEKYDKVALAFSGGVDSSYLLYEACKNKTDVKPYFVKTLFQPDFEKVIKI